MDFLKEFILIFNALIIILAIIIAILGFISLIFVIANRSLSPKERVYHHLVGTFNLVIFAEIILGLIYTCYIQDSELDWILFCLSLVFLISGIFTNLITRNKI
jgi:nitrate reductase gamma subunit